MMPEYLYLFQMNLYNKLKDRIDASINCKINWDVLYVKIKKRDDDFEFEYELKDISNKIQYGCSTDKLTNEIIYEYKQFLWQRIEQRYFYKERI